MRRGKHQEAKAGKSAEEEGKDSSMWKVWDGGSGRKIGSETVRPVPRKIQHVCGLSTPRSTLVRSREVVSHILRNHIIRVYIF